MSHSPRPSGISMTNSYLEKDLALQVETTKYDIQLDAFNAACEFKKQLLANKHRVDQMAGRITWVLEVYQEGYGTRTGVLTDGWVAASHFRKRNIDATALKSATEEMQRYFPAVLHCSTRPFSGQPDITLSIRRNRPPSDMSAIVDPLVSSLSANTNAGKPVGYQLEPLSVISNAWPLSNRIHYSVVFEVASPLAALRNLGEIWETICGANMRLAIMQRHGWIHRDVNPLNILSYKQSGNLFDLELTTRYDPDADRSDVHIVGTKDFMSAELFARRYLYWQRRIIQMEIPKPKRSDQFMQNFLHDAESLWWVALWTIARLNPVNRVSNKDALDRRRELYFRWFPVGKRLLGNAYDAGWAISSGKDPLKSAAMPQEYQPVFDILVYWRYAIGLHVVSTQSILGQFTSGGMEDLHTDVHKLIKTDDNLARMEKIGELKLVENFPG